MQSIDPRHYQEARARRLRLSGLMKKSSVLILAAGTAKSRNRDCDFPFRQASSFFYLTGLAQEPDAVLVLELCDKGEFREDLFVRDHNQKEEQWNGPRPGPKGTVKLTGIKHCHPLEELEKRLPEILCDHATLYADPFHSNENYTRLLQRSVNKALGLRSSRPQLRQFIHPDALLAPMRLKKDALELESIEKAIAISDLAHRAAMAYVKSGVKEYEIQAVTEQVFRRHGSVFPAYTSIVASGNFANTIHYTANSETVKKGDLILMDAGAEWELYASDITRTFPVSGRFSSAQRLIYDCVLNCQLAVMEKIKPGVSLQDLRRWTKELLAKSLSKLLESKNVFFPPTSPPIQECLPYGPCHFLGLDVHDVGDMTLDAAGLEPAPLKAGSVITLEPGIHIPLKHPHFPPEFRGLGIRIEDNILVTRTGFRNLSAQIPKTPEEIELACQQDYRDFL